MASRRGYLSQAELAQYADITITDPTEADDQISMAEELIDSYVGYQDKFFDYILQGRVSQAGTTTSFTLDTRNVNNYPYTDFFVGCYAEIIGGTNMGQRNLITGSSSTGVITTEAFTAACDTTTFYKIFQAGKFPRDETYGDIFYDSLQSVPRYYKSIPEAVKRAVAAQVEFVVQMGDKYFSTDASERTSESIGDYSYTKGGGRNASKSTAPLIAPKAQMLLRGIVNRTGYVVK